jgi:hypothetical protein
MEGYILAILALMDELAKHLAPSQRVKLYFEENEVHAALRERALIFWRKQNKTSSGWSVLAEWGSVPKGTLTEAPDYLCYALHHSHIDPNSQKAQLTVPILADPPIWNHTNKETVDKWLTAINATRTRPVPALTPHIKRMIRT